mmetsp:Transcript_45169/g.118542  ORF Transcript_45169/g.118542 Transcript_45169/m.118542 type:complete len:256 (+) Transcript_45169:654-1421(+)
MDVLSPSDGSTAGSARTSSLCSGSSWALGSSQGIRSRGPSASWTARPRCSMLLASVRPWSFTVASFSRPLRALIRAGTLRMPQRWSSPSQSSQGRAAAHLDGWLGGTVRRCSWEALPVWCSVWASPALQRLWASGHGGAARLLPERRHSLTWRHTPRRIGCARLRESRIKRCKAYSADGCTLCALPSWHPGSTSGNEIGRSSSAMCVTAEYSEYAFIRVSIGVVLGGRFGGWSRALSQMFRNSIAPLYSCTVKYV